VLPIHEALPELLSTLRNHSRAVLEAPPGAGKTTEVPLALLREPWAADKKIIMLEPRRIAARSAATFMAKKLGEDVAQTVGYRIRFDSQVGPKTRLEVVTEGVLTRMVQDDPRLSGVACVIFDEFHERHLHADLALALCLEAQGALCPDLKLLVMSATLDGERLSQFLDAPRVRSEGKSFPVQVQYLLANREEALEFHVARGIRSGLQQCEGDVLVFLPGKREIERCAKVLSDLPAHIEIHALHGELAIEAQTAAIAPAANGMRKVVLATNVAESSLTLPGVRVVVDSGLARAPIFDANTGFATLKDIHISAASATQRAGRAGRVAEGIAIRLWADSKRLELQSKAEILSADLTPLALELAAWGNASDLQFLDPPPAGVLAGSRDLLRSLGALDEREQLTALGKRMLNLGTHPRLANMMLRANTAQLGVVCDLVALMEARDPLLREERFREDWQARYNALIAYRERRAHGADSGALNRIDFAAKQWRQRLRVRREDEKATASHTLLGDLLLHAFPDRVAKSRQDASGLRYGLANGRGGEIKAESPLRGERWLIISELDGVNADARIRRAAPFDSALLQQHYRERIHSRTEQSFDSHDQAVKAQALEYFDQLQLSAKSVAVSNAEGALCQGIRSLGLRVLPISENLAQWRARVQFLVRALPDQNLPDFSDEALLAELEDWLAPYLSGKSRVAHLNSGDISEALLQRLSYAQQNFIEANAPKSLLVPSGMTRGIDYTETGPVLAVKLQELFGLADTPRVAMNRVPVTLHLLSPGGKPVQVTQDLKNFWNSTYAEVKKEMKGRYPKHPWPDDPWNAVATHRAKPRGT
jgi:ATP-dependent helicase HrpB